MVLTSAASASMHTACVRQEKPKETSTSRSLGPELLPIPILHPPIQLHRLQQRREPLSALCTKDGRLGLGTHSAGCPFGILDVKDGFPGLDEGFEGLAFLVFDALLVDLEVDEVQDVGDDFACVFEADAEAAFAGFAGEEFDEVDGVCLFQSEAVLVVLQDGVSGRGFQFMLHLTEYSHSRRHYQDQWHRTPSLPQA